MPSLADIYSFIDSQKRKAGTTLSDIASGEGFRQSGQDVSDAVTGARGQVTDLLESLFGGYPDPISPGAKQQRDRLLHPPPLDPDDPAIQTAMSFSPMGIENVLGKMLFGGIVSPSKAVTLGYKTALPQSEEFAQAVANTPGAVLTPEGLQMAIARSQQPAQALEPSVRGGVFYLPQGDPRRKFYGGTSGYGGSEKISGDTLLQNPLFVKGATGGTAPKAAYDSIAGSGAYESMRNEALDANPHVGGAADRIEDFLAKYAPELSGNAGYILANSRKGNTLAYALQEAAVASAVRRAGHDAVLGYSRKRTGAPFLSELFDVRESHYPDAFGGSETWPREVLRPGLE